MLTIEEKLSFEKTNPFNWFENNAQNTNAFTATLSNYLIEAYVYKIKK